MEINIIRMDVKMGKFFIEVCKIDGSYVVFENGTKKYVH